jgi:hypothetical protein
MGLDFKKRPQRPRSRNQILIVLVLVLLGSILLANIADLELSPYFRGSADE